MSDSIRIHPTSVVEPGAELGAGVDVGPFCHVGPRVVLGRDVRLISHVVVSGDTTIGAGSVVYPNAVLGTDPQNTAYKGETTTLIIGEQVVIREGVTMHRGTGNARGTTTVGDHCMFLAYSHVAHDCAIGNHVTFANNVMIGGHTTIGDRVIIGGGAGLHQFCTVGHHAFIGGMAAVAHDVIPYGLVMGNRASLDGLNLVGLKRSGMSRDDIQAMRRAFKVLFFGEGETVRDNAETVLVEFADCAPVLDMAAFVLADKKRKLTTPRTGAKQREPVED